jgi:hypothetical protein
MFTVTKKSLLVKGGFLPMILIRLSQYQTELVLYFLPIHVETRGASPPCKPLSCGTPHRSSRRTRGAAGEVQIVKYVKTHLIKILFRNEPD